MAELFRLVNNVWEREAEGVTTTWGAGADGVTPTLTIEGEHYDAITITVRPNNFKLDVADRRATFVVPAQGNSAATLWALRLPDPRAMRRFHEYYSAAIAEDPAEEETDYEDAQEELPEDADQGRANRLAVAQEPFRAAAMGAGARSFLLSDRQYQVVDNGGLRILGGPNPLGMNMTPTQAIHMSGSQTAVLGGGTQRRLFQTDMETGRVVKIYDGQVNDEGIVDISNNNRGSIQPLLVASTRVGVGRFDVRTPQGVVQQMAAPAVLPFVGGKMNYASLKSGQYLTCHATAGNGDVVVGSEDGQVRFYDEAMLQKECRAARMTIQATLKKGHCITDMDVTYDGKWVLATTRDYLLLIPTGSDARESKNHRLLRLKLEDVQKTGEAPLEKGQFSMVTTSGAEERRIVATCGNYTVKWSFRAVKSATAPDASSAGRIAVNSYTLTAVGLPGERIIESAFLPAGTVLSFSDTVAYTQEYPEEAA